MAEGVNEVRNRRDRKNKMRGKVDKGGEETQNCVEAQARQAIGTLGRIGEREIAIFLFIYKDPLKVLFAIVREE